MGKSIMMILMMFAPPLLAEESDSISMKWGLGLISPRDFIEPDGFNFPEGWVTAYDAKREPFAKMRKIRITSEYSSYWILELFVPALDTIYDVQIEKDEIEVTYEGTCPTFYAVDGNYVRILSNTIPEYEIWISIAQLDELGFRIQTWKEFMAQHETFYYPLFHRTAHLRETPSDTAAIVAEITDANNKEFEIVLTGQWQGDWAYATVELLTEIYGRDRKVLAHWKGWIKVIDPKGFPLIWYYSRGC